MTHRFSFGWWDGRKRSSWAQDALSNSKSPIVSRWRYFCAFRDDAVVERGQHWQDTEYGRSPKERDALDPSRSLTQSGAYWETGLWQQEETVGRCQGPSPGWAAMVVVVGARAWGNDATYS